MSYRFTSFSFQIKWFEKIWRDQVLFPLTDVMWAIVRLRMVFSFAWFVKVYFTHRFGHQSWIQGTWRWMVQRWSTKRSRLWRDGQTRPGADPVLYRIKECCESWRACRPPWGRDRKERRGRENAPRGLVLMSRLNIRGWLRNGPTKYWEQYWKARCGGKGVCVSCRAKLLHACHRRALSPKPDCRTAANRPNPEEAFFCLACCAFLQLPTFKNRNF